MWLRRKGSGGHEVIKAARGHWKGAGGCGIGGWVERGGWGAQFWGAQFWKGACAVRVHTARAGGAPGIDLDQRSSWHVEDCGERGAVGVHSFGRPAEAERPAAGDTGRPHGLRTPAPVASNWVAKSGRPALMCTSCGVGDWCGGGAGGESIIGVVGHRGRRHCRRPTVAGIRIYRNTRPATPAP